MSRRKAVWITGASRSIGRARAEGFAADEYAVAVTARDADTVGGVAAALSGHGYLAGAFPADVADELAVTECFTQIQEQYGGVDVLINCAGVRVQRPLTEMSLEEWQLPLRVGLDGAFLCARAALPGMVARSWGRIINIAGISGQAGAVHRAGVATAKAGLLGLTKALAREYASAGITANAVSPGLIATERGPWTSHGDQGSVEEYYNQLAAQVPAGRMGEMAEVVAACQYLASDLAAYVTGQTLSVNGGTHFSM